MLKYIYLLCILHEDIHRRFSEAINKLVSISNFAVFTSMKITVGSLLVSSVALQCNVFFAGSATTVLFDLDNGRYATRA